MVQRCLVFAFICCLFLVQASVGQHEPRYSNIRKVDFAKLISESYSIEHDCHSHPDDLEILSVIYGDLTGDGKEEAVVDGRSCLAGTGGSDILQVYTLDPHGRPSELTVEEPKKFRGQDAFKGCWGHLHLEIRGRLLVEDFPLYREGDSNAGPSGGSRELYYRWDKRLGKFKLVGFRTFPPKK